MRVYPGLLRKRLSIAWYCNICAFGRVGFGHPIIKCQTTTQDGCNSPERCTLPGSTQQRILVVLLKTSQTVVQHPLGNDSVMMPRQLVPSGRTKAVPQAQISPGMNALGNAGSCYGGSVLTSP